MKKKLCKNSGFGRKVRFSCILSNVDFWFPNGNPLFFIPARFYFPHGSPNIFRITFHISKYFIISISLLRNELFPDIGILEFNTPPWKWTRILIRNYLNIIILHSNSIFRSQFITSGIFYNISERVTYLFSKTTD